MKTKKGQIGGLQELIVPIIGIAIVLIIGFLIFSEVKEQVVDKITNSTIYTNESVTSWTADTFKALTHTDCLTLTCSELLNGSKNDIIDTSHYECNSLGINITNTTNYDINATLNITYSCNYPSRAWNATSKVQNATQDIPGWLPIIIITIIGGILLGLVEMFRRSSG